MLKARLLVTHGAVAGHMGTASLPSSPGHIHDCKCSGRQIHAAETTVKGLHALLLKGASIISTCAGQPLLASETIAMPIDTGPYASLLLRQCASMPKFAEACSSCARCTVLLQAARAAVLAHARACVLIDLYLPPVDVHLTDACWMPSKCELINQGVRGSGGAGCDTISPVA